MLLRQLKQRWFIGLAISAGQAGYGFDGEALSSESLPKTALQ